MNGKEQVKIVEIKKDVEYLTKDMGEIKDDVKKVIDNHLPHIWEKIDCLDKKLAVLTAKIVIYVSIAVFIITFLMDYIFRK